jgi:hypothetical protein
MIETLEKHHVGIIVKPDDVSEIEKAHSCKFSSDCIQGTRVCMISQPYFQIPVEFIVKEGRASNYDLGFHHICYQVADQQELENFRDFIKEKKIGFRLTKLEESPLEECNRVMFFTMSKIGIIEINVKG